MLDADLLPQISNATDATGSLRPTAFVVHKEHSKLYTRVEAPMLLAVACG